jgi:hypothetical protein
MKTTVLLYREQLPKIDNDTWRVADMIEVVEVSIKILLMQYNNSK